MDLKKIYNYSFLLIAIFPLVSLRWSTNFIIIWSLLSVLQYFKEESYKDFEKKDLVNWGFLSMYYLFLLGSYLISGFNRNLLKFLETDAFFIVFPLLVILNKKNIEEKTLERSLKVFFISNVLLAIWSWGHILFLGFFKLQKENNFYQPVFRNLFSDLTSIHLPYLGLLFVFSIFIGVFWFKKATSIIFKTVILLSCLLLLSSIVTFAAQMSLLTFIVIGLFLLFFSIKTLKIRLIGIVFFLIATLLLITQTPIKQRLYSTLKVKFELPSAAFNDKEHEVNFRYGIYYCASSLLKEGFWFGIGKENLDQELQSCYDTFTFRGVNDFQKVFYNTHNQYLDMILSYGIFGAIIVLLSVFFGFFKSPNLIYKVFLFIIALALLTENIFDRQIGVVCFVFFNTLFYIKQLKTN